MVDFYEYSTPELVRLLGNRFKEYRIRCNLTQKDVSEQSGIGLTTIHKFENGIAGNILLSTFIVLLKVVGQISGLEEFDYYLIKFGNSQYSSAELEMSYYELATMAGINMMPSKLYQVDGNNHFMTKRFDRNNGKKIHTQTLAAVSPDADSYEQLITVCRKLHLPETDCYEVFRRMVFNVLANNTDDHNKNFSFVMSEDGTWRLSPAYDVTYI